MTATFIAQYHGACDECEGDLKGHEVTYGAFDRLVHVHCPESNVDRPDDTPLCPKCFCYHNGSCW